MRNKLIAEFERLHQRPVLLIDLMNMLIRHTMIKFHAINGAGQVIGGIEGCLKEISHLLREFRPKAVFWVADGGYLRKSVIISEYKKNRKLEIRCKAGIIKEEAETRGILNYQLNVLSSIIPLLKMHYIYVPNVEADDVLGLLSYVMRPNIIVSCDKDFLQLHNFTNTFIYNPMKRKILEDSDVPSYGPEYAILKSIIGDRGDNIKGINRVGWRTILKWKSNIIIEDLGQLLKLATEKNDKLGKLIISNYELIAKNYEAICLKPEITHSPDIQRVLVETLSQPAQVNYSEAVAIAKKEGLNLNLIIDNAMLFSMLT